MNKVGKVENESRSLTITMSPGWNDISSALRALNSNMARYLTYPGGATEVSAAGMAAVAPTAGSSGQALDGAVSQADVIDSFLRLCFNSST